MNQQTTTRQPRPRQRIETACGFQDGDDGPRPDGMGPSAQLPTHDVMGRLPTHDVMAITISDGIMALAADERA